MSSSSAAHPRRHRMSHLVDWFGLTKPLLSGWRWGMMKCGILDQFV
ncbi:hypothetical protein AB0H20_01570 [Nocardia fluminea]